MIDPKSLRIGNTIESFGTNGNPNEWVRWTIEHAWQFAEIEEMSDKFRPIPLSEQELIRLGFEKWGRNDMPRTLSYEYGGMTIFPSNSFCDFKGYGFMHYKPDPNNSAESARFKFEYVHQLQNLYYSLTGTELTYKVDSGLTPTEPYTKEPVVGSNGITDPGFGKVIPTDGKVEATND